MRPTRIMDDRKGQGVNSNLAAQVGQINCSPYREDKLEATLRWGRQSQSSNEELMTPQSMSLRRPSCSQFLWRLLQDHGVVWPKMNVGSYVDIRPAGDITAPTRPVCHILRLCTMELSILYVYTCAYAVALFMDNPEKGPQRPHTVKGLNWVGRWR